MPASRASIISVFAVTMSTSFLSIVGSSVIMIMMFISNKKLGDPYRRIVFGISFFDLIQSAALFLKIFKTTPEHPDTWITVGNQLSCDILGFMHFAGFNGALLFNVSLNIYLLCLIKYNLTANYYRNRVEPFLLGVPIIWAITSASIIVGAGHMNPAYLGECRIAPYPVDCLVNPDVECIKGQHTHLYRTVFRVVPTFGSFVAILVTLGMLWWTVKAQDMRMERYRMSTYSLRLRASALSAQDEEGQTSSFLRRLSTVRNERGSYPNQIRRRHLSTRRRNNGRQFLLRASWYMVAFFLTHFMIIVAVGIDWTGGKPPFPVIFAARVMETWQGIFNIIIYTYPHLQKERRRNQDLGWWAAFKTVVASGGDDDDERTNRFREGIQGRHARSRTSNRQRRSGPPSGRTAAVSQSSVTDGTNIVRNVHSEEVTVSISTETHENTEVGPGRSENGIND